MFQNGRALLITVIVIVVVAALGLVLYIFLQNIQGTARPEITTFEQCQAISGSMILKNSPRTVRYARRKNIHKLDWLAML